MFVFPWTNLRAKYIYGLLLTWRDTQTTVMLKCESLKFRRFFLSCSEKCPSKHNAMCPSEHKYSKSVLPNKMQCVLPNMRLCVLLNMKLALSWNWYKTNSPPLQLALKPKNTRSANIRDVSTGEPVRPGSHLNFQIP